VCDLCECPHLLLYSSHIDVEQIYCKLQYLNLGKAFQAFTILLLRMVLWIVAMYGGETKVTPHKHFYGNVFEMHPTPYIILLFTFGTIDYVDRIMFRLSCLNIFQSALGLDYLKLAISRLPIFLLPTYYVQSS